MKNLESYEVHEMDLQDLRKTDGGDFGLSACLIIGGIALTFALLNADWDEIANDVSRGWNSI